MKTNTLNPSTANTVSQRDSFWNKVYELVAGDRDIVVVSADFGSPIIDKIIQHYPGQFVNVGIAEQNGIAVATGLAMSGKKVVIAAIAPFITLRCLEQIRVNNAIMKIPITVAGMGVGFSFAFAGPTHHIAEDIAIMRAMPHITINSPSDSIMCQALTEVALNSQTTNYIRVDKYVVPHLYEQGADFSQGSAVLKQGSSYIVTTGNMVHVALEAAENLNKQGMDVGVIDVYELPIKEEAFLAAVRGAKKLITLEEHYLPGGFGSAVCETLADNGILLPLKRIGLPHSKGYCYKYGGIEYIRDYYETDAPHVQRRVAEFLK